MNIINGMKRKNNPVGDLAHWAKSFYMHMVKFKEKQRGIRK